MAATLYWRGHLCEFVGGEWRYKDTGEPLGDTRPCKRCGVPPTPEGYDACSGYIPGAISACCGHGVDDGLLSRPVLVKG